jgi:hypothetical protein
VDYRRIKDRLQVSYTAEKKPEPREGFGLLL